LIGTALLFFGRKVFWLFVAGAGFVAGMSLTSRLFEGPEWLAILIGLGVGFLAALLAVILKGFAIGLAGFFVGGYLALQFLAPLFRPEGGWWPWLAFVLGGIIGIILVSIILDWALIILSSLAGASLWIEALNLHRTISLIVLVLLIAVGISFQARELRKEK
jgi:hypothetical protein